MSKKSYLEKALQWVERKGPSDVRIDLDGFDSPKSFHNKTTDETIRPDISFKDGRGGKFYTEIALKDENPQDLITKWKFLSLMASMKKGKLFLLAPKGHKMFATNLVKRYNINALVYSI